MKSGVFIDEVALIAVGAIFIAGVLTEMIEMIVIDIREEIRKRRSR